MAFGNRGGGAGRSRRWTAVPSPRRRFVQETARQPLENRKQRQGAEGEVPRPSEGGVLRARREQPTNCVNCGLDRCRSRSRRGRGGLNKNGALLIAHSRKTTSSSQSWPKRLRPCMCIVAVNDASSRTVSWATTTAPSMVLGPASGSIQNTAPFVDCSAC